MLRQITTLINERGHMSLGDLALHFRIDRSALEPMLATLVGKGRLRKLDMSNAPQCPGCSGSCTPEQSDHACYMPVERAAERQ